MNSFKAHIQDRTWQYWLILIGLVLVSGGCWIGLNQEASQDMDVTNAETAPIVGSLAPEISLNTLSGEKVNLSDFRGKPVLVNFWATWCGPCRIEMPEFQATHQEYGADFVILAINATAQDNGDIDGFVEEMGLTFPILLDEAGDVMDAYQIFGLPTSIFIDREGVIHTIHRGLVNQALIEAMLSDL